MAWKEQRTSYSLDVSEFTCEQLLQGLIDAGWVSEREAEVVAKRKATREKAPAYFLGPDEAEYLDAVSFLRAGMRPEALVHLERFLGRDWIGVLQ